MLWQLICHLIGSGHHAVKKKIAVFVHVPLPVGFSVLGQQPHRRPGHAGLSFVPQAVVVRVMEQLARHRRCGQHPGIDLVDQRPHGHFHGSCFAKAVQQFHDPAAAVQFRPQTGEAHAGDPLKFYRIRSGHQAVQRILAVGVGRRGRRDLAVFIHGLHLHAGDSLFLLIQLAVIVRVLKHRAADLRAHSHAHQCGSLSPALQGQGLDGAFPAGIALSGSIGVFSAVFRHDGENAAVVRQNDPQPVVPAPQPFQSEAAIVIRLCFAHGFAVADLNGLHGHMGIAGLALVTIAVVVQIQKSLARQRALLDHANVFILDRFALPHGKFPFQRFAGKHAAQVAARSGIPGIQKPVRQLSGEHVAIFRQVGKSEQTGFIRHQFKGLSRLFSGQPQRHACHARVVFVHNAVVVQILKNLSAERTHFRSLSLRKPKAKRRADQNDQHSIFFCVLPMVHSSASIEPSTFESYSIVNHPFFFVNAHGTWRRRCKTLLTEPKPSYV